MAKEHGSRQNCYGVRAQNTCISHFLMKMRFSQNINVHIVHNVPTKIQIDWIPQNIKNLAFSSEFLIEICTKYKL